MSKYSRNEYSLLIDLNSILVRYGFALGTGEELIDRTLNKVCSLMYKFKTNKVIFFMDQCKNNFRFNIDPNYKQNRPKLPEYISSQLKMIKNLLEKNQIPLVYHREYEADDLIISYSKQYPSIIVSTDKDLCQGIDTSTMVCFPFKNQLIDSEAVFEKYKIYPDKIALYLALVGDSADNIPGISGIGKVKATKLINQYNNVSDIIKSNPILYQNLPKMLELTTCKTDIECKNYPNIHYTKLQDIIEQSYLQSKDDIYNEENLFVF